MHIGGGGGGGGDTALPVPVYTPSIGYNMNLGVAYERAQQ